MSRIEQFLDGNGLTQGEIAERLGLDPSSVSRKIAGLRPWKQAEIDALISLLSDRLGRVVTYEEIFRATPVESEDADPVSAAS